MGEQSLTYEELFELLRKERNSEELQTLDPNMYDKIVSYLSDKKAVLDDTSEEAQLFGSSEKEKVKVQLENARKLVKELLQRREKKIILLALNRARTKSDIIDTSSLLEVEQAFFHRTVKLFSAFKKGVMEKVVSMKTPSFSFVDEIVEDSTDSDEQEADEPTIAEGDSDTEEIEQAEEPEETDEPEEKLDEEPDKEPEEDSKPTIETVRVKFKSSIPRFMGKNQEVYGPYEAEETAEISNDIAQVLIKKGRAVQVE